MSVLPLDWEVNPALERLERPNMHLSQVLPEWIIYSTTPAKVKEI